MLSFLLGRYPALKLLSHSKSMVNFVRNHHTIFSVAIPFANLTNDV